MAVEKPMTPRGVEHVCDTEFQGNGVLVEKPMTPRGVEHNDQYPPPLRVTLGGEADDAERR